MAEAAFRREPIRTNKIRRAAKGEQCTINLPGICSFDPETVVLAHISDETRGGALKADDTSSAFMCAPCHMAYDQHRTGLDEATLLALVLRAYQRTIRRLVERGVIVVPQTVETPAYERPVPKRKPKAERTKIPQRAEPWPQGRKLQSRPMRSKETI